MSKVVMPQPVNLTLHYHDTDSTVTFKLEPPTQGANASMVKKFRRRTIRESFYSPSRNYIPAIYDYYFIAEITYDWHYMNLPALWTADVITDLEVPPDFLYGGHEKWKCILDPSMNEISRTWYENMCVGFETDQPGNPRNQLPQGPVTLRFFGTEPLTAAEVRASIWDQPISLEADGEILRGIVAYRYQQGDQTIEAFALRGASFGEETNETYEIDGQQFNIKFIEGNYL